MHDVLVKSGPWSDPITAQCPVAETLRTLGSKHGALVLHCLTKGEMFFLELARELNGVSHKVLRAQLKDFEDSGLIVRSPKNDSRRRVGYALTEKGQALGSILEKLFDWSQTYP